MLINPVERDGVLLCLVGPAGGGKTTIARSLVERGGGRVTKSVSVTSRSMRQGEKEGQSYHFVSRQTFQEKVAKGEFFEWEEIHGNFYGTLKAPLDEMVRKGSDVIFDIDIRGAQSVRKHFPKHTVVTFIVPPSIGDLEVRIAARGEASSEEISRRLATAREEYEQMMLAYHRADGSEYLIINDQLDLALAAMNAILDAERLRFARFSPELAKRVCGVV